MPSPSSKPTSTYPWNRYWVLREGSIAFDSTGLLVPPRSDENDHYLNAGDVVEFHKIAKLPCLALLGEPGIGKSYAINQVRAEQHQLGQSIGGKILFVDLRSIGTEQRVFDILFESSEFKWWRAGNGQLTVFLDSLDECLLRVETLAALLADELDRLPHVNGLQLRIACRTKVWPDALEAGLKNCWGEGFGAYELAPLTAAQVEVALAHHGIEKGTFFAEMQRRDVAPFAQKPLTLDLLTKVWKKHGGHLPESRRELFQQGCLALCEESNVSRRSSRRTGHLVPKERYALAARIAATTIFSNRAAVWVGPHADLPESDFNLSEIALGHLDVDGRQIDASERNLDEVLETGLFSSRGLHRFGWAHQAYAEFLAAEFVESIGFSDRQINELLFHPFGSDQKLVPQLRETAAWVAGNRSAIFEKILNNEPDTLLASDLTNREPSDVHRIVEKFLSEIANGRFRPSEGTSRRYPKLHYNGLAAQLESWIKSPNRKNSAREEAMTIAGACNLTSIIKLLPTIALNEKEALGPRLLATALISRVGGAAERKKLRNLALGKMKSDSELRLRGMALYACLPSVVSAREVFANLVPPPSDGGAYEAFISYELERDLPDKDLPVAMAWVEAQAKNESPDGDLKRLRHKILEKAASSFDRPAIRRAFAKAVFHQLRYYDGISDELAHKWISWLGEHEPARLKIAWELFEGLEDSDEPENLAARQLRLFRREDIDLLIRQLRTSIV